MDIQRNMNMQANISYLRIRPCDNDNEIFLNSRRKEGTSSFLIKDDLNFVEINRKGFQTISNNINYESSMWLINDEDWETYMNKLVALNQYSYMFPNLHHLLTT